MDIVAFAPHPDDAELFCGGLLIKMADRGHSTAVVDLTRGEIGTRGTPDIRAKEAADAATILGLTERHNVGLPDGSLLSTVESRQVVAEAVRRLRPKLVLLPYWEDRHPDHYHASTLVYEAVHLASLRNYHCEGKPYRVRELLYYIGRAEQTPSIVVDISEQFARKSEAVHAYRSQLYTEGQTGPETNIGSQDFLRRWEARQLLFGESINTKHGEAYHLRRPVRVDDPVAFFTGATKGGVS